jgi:hypothetical protein
MPVARGGIDREITLAEHSGELAVGPLGGTLDLRHGLLSRMTGAA